MKITTIIPTLNEVENIDPILGELARHDPHEIIVVDAGSDDGTAEAALKVGVRVIVEGGGLVAQLNRAAAEAGGEVLFFIPADNRPIGNPFEAIGRALADPEVVAGGFTLDYGLKLKWRLLSFGANLRGRWMGFPMGDQGIFCRRWAFEQIGGFRLSPLLPDLDLVRRLSEIGKIAYLEERIYSSPRRYEENGVLRNWLTNQLLMIAERVYPEDAPNWTREMLARLRGRRAREP